MLVEQPALIGKYLVDAEIIRRGSNLDHLRHTKMANPHAGKRRLSLLDASFLYGESRVSPTHIGSIYMLDGELPFERVLTHIRQRLNISPRFRQRLVFSP